MSGEIDLERLGQTSSNGEERKGVHDEDRQRQDVEKEQPSSSNLMYDIDTSPPWHLAVMLGFQVRSPSSYHQTWYNLLLAVKQYFSLTALLDNVWVNTVNSLLPDAQNVHRGRRSVAGLHHIHNVLRFGTHHPFANHFWQQVPTIHQKNRIKALKVQNLLIHYQGLQ